MCADFLIKVETFSLNGGNTTHTSSCQYPSSDEPSTLKIAFEAPEFVGVALRREYLVFFLGFI